MKLHTRIFVGLAAGVVLGTLSKVVGTIGLQAVLIAFEPAGLVFIRLITMVVIPLVIASLVVGIASLGEARQVGRIGGSTLGYFVATTFAGATLGTLVALVSRVGANLPDDTRRSLTEMGERGAQAIASARPAPGLVQTIVDMIPTNPFAAAAQGELMPLIVAVALFGAALAVVTPDHRRPVVAFFEGVNDACMVLIRWLMWLAPFAVGILVAATIARFGLDLLESLLAFCLVVVVALAVHVGVTLLPALRFGGGMSPVKFFPAVSDALLFAFSTASSNATLPVSMAAATNRLHVPTSIAGFVLPSGATINKNGSAVYKAVTAVFLAHLYGLPLGLEQVVTIVLTSTLAAFTGAGVPGSSLVTTLIVLQAIGLGPQAAAGIALVAGVDRPLDMCRTVTNTIGNLVGSVLIARSSPPDPLSATRRGGTQA